MKVGDKLKMKPTIYGSVGEEAMRTQDAVVVYIHPLRRYYVVEFTGPAPNYLKFREAFSCQDRRGGE